MLRDVLAAMNRAIAEPSGRAPYNVVVHNGPALGDPPYHWWIAVVPRVAVVAGFEMGTGSPREHARPARRGAEAPRRALASAADEPRLSGPVLEEAAHPDCGVLGREHLTKASPSRSSPSARQPSSPSSIARLASPIATTAPAANDAAHSSAFDSTSSAGTTRSTRPIANASSARTCRPDQISSFARGGADEPGEALRASRAGDDPQQDLGLAEARRVGRDAEIACERELEPATEREAPDGRDHRPRDRSERVERLAEGRPDAPGVLRTTELRDVGSGGERLLAPRDDDRMHAVLDRELARRRAELAEQRLRQGVERRDA